MSDVTSIPQSKAAENGSAAKKSKKANIVKVTRPPTQKQRVMGLLLKLKDGERLTPTQIKTVFEKNQWQKEPSTALTYLVREGSILNRDGEYAASAEGRRNPKYIK